MPSFRFTVYGPEQGFFLSFLHDFKTLAYIVGHSGTVQLPRPGAQVEEILSVIFAEGNGEGSGPGFTIEGRSMSVGDVVHVAGFGAWLCDSVGWKGIPPADARRFPLVE
ncbi:hypothetical protein [Longimicrobium terrae]|uniref:Uncharacterized protein n=1 Tax=Longimicrobium terrae TaxID=1639882 RepID=A0A841GWM1_9BACT|nr:hypothetical protein [Longimicrobium terrae]MBB4635878.1 hypothetical protein [Longimicrobium terrae]MBB6070274.1 hypothetical protein [Longimicrobium terrae]NNC30778.1 hypothetical protein [Longimicrobium terrae]